MKKKTLPGNGFVWLKMSFHFFFYFNNSFRVLYFLSLFFLISLYTDTYVCSKKEDKQKKNAYKDIWDVYT